MVQKANSGHPGAPMGCAPMTDALFRRGLMKYDPAQPKWIARDRFVLSNGHASILLYSMLHLTGYGLTLDDLRAFRTWGSATPGHPERHHTAGVEVTTVVDACAKTATASISQGRGARTPREVRARAVVTRSSLGAG